MSVPGFTADTSLENTRTYKTFSPKSHSGIGVVLDQYSTPVIKAAFQIVDDLPTESKEVEVEVCRTVPVYGPCGSAPEGEDPPYCPTGETVEQCWTEEIS